MNTQIEGFLNPNFQHKYGAIFLTRSLVTQLESALVIRRNSRALISRSFTKYPPLFPAWNFESLDVLIQ